MQHGRHLPVHLPGVAEARRGVVEKEHEHLALPDGLALEFLYDRLPVKGKINEDSAQVVTSIFHWFVEDGLTLRGIASRLMAQAVPTARGSGHWYPSVIRKILDLRSDPRCRE